MATYKSKREASETHPAHTLILGLQNTEKIPCCRVSCPPYCKLIEPVWADVCHWQSTLGAPAVDFNSGVPLPSCCPSARCTPHSPDSPTHPPGVSLLVPPSGSLSWTVRAGLCVSLPGLQGFLCLCLALQGPPWIGTLLLSPIPLTVSSLRMGRGSPLPLRKGLARSRCSVAAYWPQQTRTPQTRGRPFRKTLTRSSNAVNPCICVYLILP